MFPDCAEKIGKPVRPFIPPGKYDFNSFQKDALADTETTVLDDIKTVIILWDIFSLPWLLESEFRILN